jgi:transposase-like protein
MARTKANKTRSRRSFSEEFKQEAVQMLLDGRETLRQAGPAARTLGERVSQLEEDSAGCLSWTLFCLFKNLFKRHELLVRL